MLNKWKSYILWIIVSLGTGILSGLFSSGGMELYSEMITKPPLSPPGVLFPIVWTILYTLMGVSAAMIWDSEPSRERTRSINLFVAQLIVNFFWSLIFFNAQAFGFAAVWLVILWALVLLMILSFKKVNLTAAWLQLPYLIWLTFAAYLNFGVYLLN